MDTVTTKRVFFFSGSEYWRFDVAADTVPSQYPRQISGPWPGLFTSGVDAAFPWQNSKVYFFSGSEYSRYDALLDRVDSGYPKPIAGNWPGVAGTGFEHGIDAALNWGNGQVYWFKGSQYVRLSFAVGTGWAMDAGYPKQIGGNWPGVAGTGFEHGIDAAINWGNGNRYWFRADQYIRMIEDSAGTKTMDAGYPKPMAGNWAGVPTGVDAAVEWPLAELAAGTFQVPTARSGWVGPAPQADGSNRWGESFRMEVDFVGTSPHPTMCSAGEYRQLVRGSFSLQNPITGAMDAIEHHLPNMAGGAPILMQGAPAAGAASDNFLEDGHVGGHWQYGHRRAPATNPGPHNQFLPDRDTGCQYRGTDFPSLSWTPGTPYAVALDFRGSAVDSATAGEILATIDWSVSGSGAL